MKSKVLFTLLISLFAATIYADTHIDLFAKPGRKGAHSRRTWSTAFVGLSGGAGIPMSDYAKADTILGAGYAKIGVHFNLTAGVKFMPYLGAMLMAGGTFNGFNTTAYAKQDTQKYAPTYTSKPYYLGQYMVGPFLYFTDGESYDVTVRALGGLAMVTFPLLTATSSSPGWTQVKTIEKPSAKSFGYCVGVGVNFKVGSRIGILVNADYYGTKVSYTNEKTSSNVDFFLTGIKASSTAIDTQKVSQVIGVLNVSAGVSLNF
jgi:hypothetical protein